MNQQSYNFATAISMVIGVVIGSGIFFKADDVLIAVNGNVKVGMLGFLIVGLGVVFGALAIAEYANYDQKNQGLLAYAEMAVNRKFAYVVGWIMMMCYFPTLMVILALLTAEYLGMLIGINSQLYVSVATFIILFSNLYINYRFPKASGDLQLLTTIAKIIPLIGIGIVGLIFFDGTPVPSIPSAKLTDGVPLSSLIAIAFAFDGWIVATNIAGDIENSKKNLPRALAIGSGVITIIYMLYFIGVTRVLSPGQIVTLGDEHILIIATKLLGPLGAKVILTFIVISVYGGFNGMTLAFIRLPKEMYDLKLLKTRDNQVNMFWFSAILCTSITIFWYLFEQLIDYQVIFSQLNTPFDISSMPIVIIYLIYIVLFVAVNKVVVNETKIKRVYFLVISAIATITALMIVIGSLGANGLLYIILSLVLLGFSIPFYQSKV